MKLLVKKDSVTPASHTLALYEDNVFSTGQHPLSIWNPSYIKVIDKLEKVVGHVEGIIYSGKPSIHAHNYLKELLEEYESLLHNLVILLTDDTEEIIKLFAPDFKKNPHVKQFFAETNSFRDYIAKIINKIKHHQRYFIVVNHNYNGLAIPGYTVAVTINRHKSLALKFIKKEAIWQLRFIMI